MFYLEAHDDVWGSLLALGHDVVHVELVGHLLTDVVHDRLHLGSSSSGNEEHGDDGHLLLPGRGGPSPAARLPWLEFKDSLEEFLRGGREEPDLGVGVQPVQVRRLLHMELGLLGTCYNYNTTTTTTQL